MAASDVVVVGGGIIGCSLAWRLAGAGARVTLLERGQPGREASWAAAGLLEPAGGGYGGVAADPLLGHWLEGLRRYGDYVAAIKEDTGMAFEYRVTGRLLFAFAEGDLPALRETQRLQDEAGIATAFWGAERVREEEPNAPPEVAGALYFPDHGLVDNRGLMAALPVAAARRGVDVRAGVAVARVATEGDRVVGVETATGERVAAGAVVVAAGSWSGQIGPRPVPVVPNKGQIIAFSAPRPLFRHILSMPGGGLSPRGDGRIIFGATSHDAGFDKRVTAGGVAHLLAGALRLCPAVADLSIHETWAGLRPIVPPARVPVLGAASTAGLYYATGHAGMGILSAPATAEALAGLILDGRSPLPIDAFSPRRFDMA